MHAPPIPDMELKDWLIIFGIMGAGMAVVYLFLLVVCVFLLLFVVFCLVFLNASFCCI